MPHLERDVGVVADVRKRFGRKVYAIEYQHALDGTNYRHDFADGSYVGLEADDDGSLHIRSRAGRPLWGEYESGNQVRTMMRNPRGRKVKRGKAGRAARRSTTPRQTTRRAGVPAWVKAKGFSSWATYMASIRPGGTTVAKRKRKAKRAASAPRRRRRSVARAAAAPHHRARRRTMRRNPIGNLLGGARPRISYAPKSLMMTAVHGAVDGVVGTLGQGTARLARGRINLEGNTIKGAIVEALVGIGTAPLVAKLSEDAARAWVQGVFQGIITTTVKSRNIPVLAAALGDEGELPLFGGSYDELGGAYEIREVGGGAGGIGDVEYLAGEREYM